MAPQPRPTARSRRPPPAPTGNTPGRVIPLWQRFRRDRGIARLPTAAAAAPPWLHTLQRVHRWSTLAALGLGVAVGVAYAQSAIVEQRWSRTYQRLQTLQRHERELQVNLAILKDQLARQAATSAAQMALPNPKNSVFLPPNNRSAFEDGGDRPNEATAPTARPPEPPAPLGY
jgi:hypothetical protein